jgi:hypothetical protein
MIQDAVASALLKRLEGFKGFPKKGLEIFAEALASACVSVDHARAVCESFDMAFPTVREIRDSANSLRDKFEVHPDQRKAWEAELREKDPNWKHDPYWKPIPAGCLNPVKARENELYHKLRIELVREKDPSWKLMAETARRLGYTEYADAWERAMVR